MGKQLCHDDTLFGEGSDSSSDISIELEATYEATMRAPYFGADPLPGWGAFCRRVAERRDLL